jgi:hypothetical protein
LSVLRFLRDKYNQQRIEHAKSVLQKLDPKVLQETDDVKIRGVLSMGYGRHYEYVKDIFGNLVRKCVLDDVAWQKENLVILPGNQYVFCKLFNLPITVTGGTVMTPISNVTPGFLNDTTQMNFDNKDHVPNDLVGVNLHPLHFINGFTVGYGGASEDNLVALDVNYKSRTLYHPVPFQYTSENVNEKGLRYGGKVTHKDKSGSKSNVVSYFIKTFDSNPTAQIYHLWKDNGLNDGTPVTQSVFDTIQDNGMDVETYAEAELSIEPFECRDYFKSFLSGEPPRINELGLTAQFWDLDAKDALQAQQITHITFPTESLMGTDTSIGAKAIYLLYRLYLK